MDAKEKVNSYDYAAAPCMNFYVAGRHHLSIEDPVIVQDMMVSKNAQLDKTGIFERTLKNLIGNSFLFSQSDEVWKTKRKAMAHAFYKNRLVVMLDVFKKQIDEAQKLWINEIKAKGKMQIDISKDILKIFQSFLMHVTLGASDNSIKVDIFKKVNRPEGAVYELQSMTVSEAVEESFQQTLIGLGTRTMNPIWRLINFTTGYNPAFTTLEKYSNINCAALRHALLTFVR